MAPVNPSYALQNRTDHLASTFRMAMVGLVNGGPLAQGVTAPLGGVHSTLGNRMVVTGNAAMTVNIDTGLVYIPATPAWNGMYAAYNSALYTISIPAASATQWRSDYICAIQNDSATSTNYAGVTTGVDGWDIVDVPGAFSSSAPGVLPSVPNNAVTLAVIRVTPNMTVTNGAGTVVDFRQYIPLSGPWPTTSGSKPSLSAPEGTMWWEQDTNLLGILVNNTYQYIPTYPVNTDVWHNLGTILGGWTVSGVARYKRTVDNEVRVDLNNIVPPGTPPSDGTVIWTTPNGLPVGYRPLRTYRLTAYSHNSGTEQPAWEIGTGGAITVFGVGGTTTNRLDLYGKFPLD